ncbi:MAG TPA: hypothetical protein VFF65_01535 [Phycisphaerales bacterium]|nr:hypothetical protein [Phycisphaerales bacterium]
MRAFLDEQSLTIPTAPAGGPATGSVAAAISAAKAAAAAKGRVIVDILVDGQRLDDEALDAPSTLPAGDIELKCISADPRQLVADSFSDVARAVDELRPVQREAAEALQTGKLDSAFEGLTAALQVWDAVHRVTEQGPALLGANLTSLAAETEGGRAVLEELASLSATLQQVKDAVSTQDWSTLSDLLSHELDEAAGRWSRLLDALAKGAVGFGKGGA